MALSDPSLFNSNGELTTKEILKRVGERTANGLGRSYSDVTEAAVGVLRHNHDNNPGRLFARRVETDSSVWQNDERSVRTVQDLPAPSTNNLDNGGSGTATPPQQPRWQGAVPEEGPGYGPSYAQQRLDGSPVRSESVDRGGQRREWRNSGWVRQDGSAPIPGTG